MRRGLIVLVVSVLGLVFGCGTQPGKPEEAVEEGAESAAESTEQAGLAALRKAVEQSPDDAVAHQQLGRGLRDARMRDASIAAFERAYELAPDNPRIQLDLAIAYASVARLDDADEIYRILERTPATRALALHNRGNLALRKSEFERAAELYRAAIEIKPDYMLAYYHLGTVLERLDQPAEAYRTYGQVLELEPPQDPTLLGGYVDALYRMGKLDLKMGATERAARLLAELVAAYPDHPNAHYQYGQALLRLDRPEEAEREIAKHMEIMARQKPQGPVATGE